MREGEDARADCWAQLPDKTECGSHLGTTGRFTWGGPTKLPVRQYFGGTYRSRGISERS